VERVEAGKRAPRRQTLGADYPRLGTTTAMFIGRNGGKRESSQKVKKKKGEICLLYSRGTWNKYVPFAEKKKFVVMDNEDGEGALSSPPARGMRRISRQDDFDVGNYNE